MNSPDDNIYVTKLAAAQRQILAAIRMFFAQEDELAVHTVASAGYRILRDIKKNRGHDEVNDVWRATLFYSVKAYIDGELSTELAESKEWMSIMAEIVYQIPNWESLSFEDFKVALPDGYAKKYWRWWNRPSNFLKHADQDYDGLLPLNEVNNLLLLMAACSAYFDLARRGVGIEGVVLAIYHELATGYSGEKKFRKKFHHIYEQLEPLDDGMRLAFCSRIIHDHK